MFENTLKAVCDMDLTYLHVFPYSPRPGTPAANMPQVAKAVRAERASRLREAGDVLRKKFFESRVGKTADVLIEKDGRGHCPQFAPVHGLTDAEPGTIVAARIERAEQSHLIGRLIGSIAS
jgi:threonylcarbamoyladenosine tRNA methylthiotransferase MtaB